MGTTLMGKMHARWQKKYDSIKVNRWLCNRQINRTRRRMINLTSKSLNVQRVIVELKAKVNDLEKIRNKLITSRAEYLGTFHQIDTYYNVPKGRLKLRELENDVDAELIYYERENVAEPKKSSVFILAIPQSKAFKQILERIANIRVVVEKVREIFIYEGVQIHLDKVKGLGSFIELEYLTS